MSLNSIVIVMMFGRLAARAPLDQCQGLAVVVLLMIYENDFDTLWF